MPLPTWEGGVAGRTFCDTKMLSIPVSAKYPEQAYEFIRFYSTEGAIIRAGGFTAIKGADTKTTINALVGDEPEALYNMESLYAVFSNPNMVYNAPIMAPEYNQEIQDMFIEESDKYMVGGQSLDECIAAIMERGKAIIEKY